MQYQWICICLIIYIYGTWVEEILKPIKEKTEAKEKKEYDEMMAKFEAELANVKKDDKKTKEGEEDNIYFGDFITEKDLGKVV